MQVQVQQRGTRDVYRFTQRLIDQLYVVETVGAPEIYNQVPAGVTSPIPLRPMVQGVRFDFFGRRSIPRRPLIVQGWQCFFRMGSAWRILGSRAADTCVQVDPQLEDRLGISHSVLQSVDDPETREPRI